MDKLHSIILCLIVFGLSLLQIAECSEGEDGGNKTCEIAKYFAKPSPPNDKVRVHCDTDESCAGFHCRGIYLVDNAHMHIKKGDPVCFGAIINHCDDPLSMDIYIQSVLMKSSFQNRLHHNASIQIPGVTLRADRITADLFIFVEMVHEDQEVTIALTAKVRYTVGKIVNWPESLNFQVFPEQTFPVPPCLPGESRNVTPIPVFPSCVVPTELPPSLPPAVTVIPKSATFGKDCDPTVLYGCRDNEMCTFNEAEVHKHWCVCSPGMVLNPFSGLCDSPGASPTPTHKLNPAATTITTVTTTTEASSGEEAAPHKAAADHTKKGTSGLITGLAVGAVAVLGIVILISFLVWRSRGSGQFDHVPILDSDEAIML